MSSVTTPYNQRPQLSLPHEGFVTNVNESDRDAVHWLRDVA